MEPINIETVLYAQDFFFHLSDKQVEEKLSEFKPRQPFIYSMMNYTAQQMKGREQRLIFWRIMLAMDYCFNIYPIKLTKITKEMVLVPVNKLVNITKLITEGKIPDQSLRGDVDAIEQTNLFAFIGQMCYDYREIKKVLNESETKEILLCATLLGQAYQTEVKYLMDKKDIN
jgi:hypothetical protein